MRTLITIALTALALTLAACGGTTVNKTVTTSPKAQAPTTTTEPASGLSSSQEAILDMVVAQKPGTVARICELPSSMRHTFARGYNETGAAKSGASGSEAFDYIRQNYC